MTDPAFRTALSRFMETNPSEQRLRDFIDGYNAGSAAVLIRQCAAWSHQPNPEILLELAQGCPE